MRNGIVMMPAFGGTDAPPSADFRRIRRKDGGCRTINFLYGSISLEGLIHLSQMRYHSATLGKSLLDLGRVNPFVFVELEDEGSILAVFSIYLHAFRIISKA